MHSVVSRSTASTRSGQNGRSTSQNGRSTSQNSASSRSKPATSISVVSSGALVSSRRIAHPGDSGGGPPTAVGPSTEPTPPGPPFTPGTLDTPDTAPTPDTAVTAVGQSGSAPTEYIEVGGTDHPGSVSITKPAGAKWGIGVQIDPVCGVVVTKVTPGGVGAQHHLEVGSTFTRIDGTDARTMDKSELLHTLRTQNTISVVAGPMWTQTENTASHYYPQH